MKNNPENPKKPKNPILAPQNSIVPREDVFL